MKWNESFPLSAHQCLFFFDKKKINDRETIKKKKSRGKENTLLKTFSSQKSPLRKLSHNWKLIYEHFLIKRPGFRSECDNQWVERALVFAYVLHRVAVSICISDGKYKHPSLHNYNLTVYGPR